MFRKLLTVDYRFSVLSSWLTAISKFPPHPWGVPHSGLPLLPLLKPPQSVLSWPSQQTLTLSLDPGLSFSSLFPGRWFARAWTLMFLCPHPPLGTYLAFSFPSEPPNLESQDLLLTQKRRLSLAENSPGAGTLAILFTATSLRVSGACWLTVPLVKYLLKWMKEPH